MCGPCNYTPVILGRLLPWRYKLGVFPNGMSTPSDGHMKVSYGFTAGNILPGDILVWEISYDGTSFQPVETAWNVLNGWTHIYSHENTDGFDGEQDGDELWVRLTVSRSGCSDFVVTNKYELSITDDQVATNEGRKWTLTSNGAFVHSTETDGDVNYVTTYEDFGYSNTYTPCPGEDLLIPDEYEIDYELSVDVCCDVGIIINLQKELTDGLGQEILLLDYMRVSTHPVQGNARAIYFSNCFAYWCAVDEDGLVDSMILEVQDQWQRTYYVKVRIQLICDRMSETVDCGIVTLEPQLHGELALIVENELGVYPWRNSAVNVEGVPANTYVPPSGQAVWNWYFFLTGVLESDSVLWEYSQDGTNWYAWDVGPDPMAATAIDDRLFWSAWTSDRDEKVNPQLEQSVMIRATITRVIDVYGNMKSYQVEKSLQVKGVGVTGMGAQSPVWQLWVDGVLFKTYSASSLEFSDVVGQGEYTSCVACGDEQDSTSELDTSIECYLDFIGENLLS